MKPNPKFQHQHKVFWANVRSISEVKGYVVKPGGRDKPKIGKIRIFSTDDIIDAFQKLELNHYHIIDRQGNLTDFGTVLIKYFEYRANLLNTIVEPLLMRLEDAVQIFTELKKNLNPTCPLPLNKQKGNKAGYAYFTGIINMLIEDNIDGFPVDYDPKRLTTITYDGKPQRTLSRRIDGAFPSPVNPIAVWEIKEYYYTTTFGSRVADGVYETMLDGMELEELRLSTRREINHYLMVDDYFTWWEKGRSYLCRIIDMMHMGYVGEVLFGREVIHRLPEIVKEWVSIAESRGIAKVS
jgi:hypothetical protein